MTISGAVAPGADRQSAAVGHGLEGVQDEVDDDQLEQVLHALGVNRAGRGGQPPFDGRSGRRLAGGEHQRVLQHVEHVDLRRLRDRPGSGETQQALDDERSPVDSAR